MTGNHGSNDYWIVKLNSSGAIVWQKSLGGSATDNAYSIHQTSDGGYIMAGGSQSSDGDVVYNHTAMDYWIVKLPIIFTINVSVFPTAAGTISGDGPQGLGQTAILTATPDSLYAFTNWTENGTVVSTNPIYSFTVTSDVNLVANFASIYNQDICYVEFDTLTFKNKVVWGIPPAGSDSIFVYSEVSTNSFNLIGKASATAICFVDTNSTPQNMSNSYKISVANIYGNEGALSDYHKTITLLSAYDQPSNTYGFTWSAYEGLPVSNYYLYGIMNSGQVIQIGSVPGNTYFYNYPNPSPLFVKFFVGFETPECSAKANHVVRSNYLNSVLAGIEDSEIAQYSVYPNPTENEIFIESSFNQNYQISITNSQGQLLKQKSLSGTKNMIDVSEYSAGIYFVKIQTESGVQILRFVK